MRTRPHLYLIVRDGGRGDLGRRMLRAYLEHRHADGRALVERIAYRATLRAVGGKRGEVARSDDDAR